MLLLLIRLSAALPAAAGPPLGDVSLWDFAAPGEARVVFASTPGVDFVGIACAIAVGAGDDPPERAGLAHLVAHLVGTSRPAEALALEGVELQTRTTLDSTLFSSLGPRGAWSLQARQCQKLLHDPLEHLTVARLDQAREQVRTERGAGELGGHHDPARGPGPWANAALGILLHPADQPPARAGRGALWDEGALDRITLDDVGEFVTAHYHPANTHVFVRGALEQHEIAPFVRALQHGPTAARGPPAASASLDVPPPVLMPAVPAEVRGRWTGVSRLVAPVDRRWLVLGWRLPYDRPGADVLLDVVSARVRAAVVEGLGRLGPVDGAVDCAVLLGRRSGQLGCQIELGPRQQALGVLEAAVSALSSAWAPIGETAGAYERSILLSRTISHVGSPDSASSFALVGPVDWMLRTGSVTWMSDRVSAVAASTPTRVADWARRYVTRARLVAAVLEPGGEWLPGVLERSGVLSLSTPNIPDAASFVPAGDAERVRGSLWTTLPTGMRAVVVDHGDGLPALTLRFDAGTRSFPGHLGSFALGMVEVGPPREASDLRWAEPAESMVTRAASTDYHTLLTEALSGEDLETTLRRIRAKIEGLVVDMGRRTMWNTRSALAGAPRTTTAQASLSRWLTLLPALGGLGLPTPAWSRDEVEATLSQIFRPDRASLVVVGPVDGPEVIATIAAVFGDWQGRRPARRATLLTDSPWSLPIGAPGGMSGAAIDASDPGDSAERAPPLVAPPQVFHHPSPLVVLHRACTLGLPRGVHPGVVEQLLVLLEGRAHEVLGLSGAATQIKAEAERLPWVFAPEPTEADTFLFTVSASVRLAELHRLGHLTEALAAPARLDALSAASRIASGRDNLRFASNLSLLARLLDGLSGPPSGLYPAPPALAEAWWSARLRRCANESVITLVGDADGIVSVLDAAGIAAQRMPGDASMGSGR